MRDEFVRALSQRIASYEAGDVAPVLDESALIEAERLAELFEGRAGTGECLDEEALIVLAYLHWYRYLTLPEDQNRRDAARALEWFARLRLVAPGAVPESVRNYLNEVAPMPATRTHRWRRASDSLREYKTSGDLKALNEAVDVLRALDRATPDAGPDKPLTLSALGDALQERSRRLGRAEDVHAAVSVLGGAVRSTPPDDTYLGPRLSNLAIALHTRHELLNQRTDVADLTAAINAGQAALDLASADDPNRPAYLSNLGMFFKTRYDETGQPDDLEASITAVRAAVDGTPRGHDGRGGRLANLGSLLRARFDLTGSVDDINAAIEAGNQAVEMTPREDPNHAGFLSNVGNAYMQRFARTGDPEDVDAAIGAGRQAVHETPSGSPDRARLLANLGMAFQVRFVTGGAPADLDDAIDVARQGLTSTPAGIREGAGHLTSLGVALRLRFELSGRPGDIDAAVGAARESMRDVPSGHPDRAGFLSNLANALTTRFRSTGRHDDVDEAVDVLREAIEATPRGHPDRAGYMSNLGNALASRFGDTRQQHDIDEAILVLRQAAALAAPDHTGRKGYLSNLGGALIARSEQAASADDLAEGIDVLRSSAELFRPDDPDRAKTLANLGSAWRARFERTGLTSSLTRAIECQRLAATIETAPPLVRIEAARSWGTWAVASGDHESAATGYAVAVGLLPVVAWHGLDLATREDQLAEWSGLAAEAAACAVADGQPEKAVELLEMGRSVLWAQLVHTRTDLARLAERSPDLAARLDGLRVGLDRPLGAGERVGAAGGGSAALGRAAEDAAVDLRRRLAREWDAAVAQVRRLEGFEHFLEPTPFDELRTAASGGSVVIVNVSAAGCHALVVGGWVGVRVVELPRLSYDAAVDHANAWLDVLPAAYDRGWHPFEEDWEARDPDREGGSPFAVLAWLWEAIAGPVLDALGHAAAPGAGGPWPRVWWCPTGPLAVLPIHAAGRWLDADGPGSARDTVPARVVSSYTTTLAALQRARQAVPHREPRQLAVGMPLTPGFNALPAVERELQVLTGHFRPPEKARQLVGPEATRGEVLELLAQYSWAHLACHGVQHATDPSRSFFALWDGPLTVDDLAGIAMHHADLAFLSACQTAAGSTRLLDESVHLAAATQILGYRHVIATLWTIADAPAPEVAAAVYATIAPADRPDASHAATALHHALENLRDTYPDQPLLWAPYIHLGP